MFRQGPDIHSVITTEICLRFNETVNEIKTFSMESKLYIKSGKAKSPQK